VCERLCGGRRLFSGCVGCCVSAFLVCWEGVGAGNVFAGCGKSVGWGCLGTSDRDRVYVSLGPQRPHGPAWLPTDPSRQHTNPLCWPDLVAWPPWDPTPSRACLLAVLLPCPRHHCRPVCSRPCLLLARFEPFSLAAQLTGPGFYGRIHSQSHVASPTISLARIHRRCFPSPPGSCCIDP